MRLRSCVERVCDSDFLAPRFQLLAISSEGQVDIRAADFYAENVIRVKACPVFMIS